RPDLECAAAGLPPDTAAPPAPARSCWRTQENPAPARALNHLLRGSLLFESIPVPSLRPLPEAGFPRAASEKLLCHVRTPPARLPAPSFPPSASELAWPAE